MVTTLKGLKAAGVTNNNKINILACFDSVYPPAKTSFYVFDSRSTTSSGVENDIFASIQSETDIPDQNLFRVNTGQGIREFICWGVEKYPAENYFLILSGHGDAFRGKTLMYDENPLGGLTLKDLSGVLRDAKECLGVDKRFAVLGFDNCAMNLIEVGYEFKNVADYLVSSEGFIPKSGWEYESPLKYLIENPNSGSEDIAKKFVEEFTNYQYDHTIGGRSVDLSLCKLETLRNAGDKESTNNIAKELNNLGKILYEISKHTTVKRSLLESVV
jgi:hypothetical protein